MKTTDSVMREIKDICTYYGDEGTSGYCLSNEQFGKLEALYSHSLAEARREWVEEMRGKANLIEVRSEARYLTNSGFWATKKLVAKDDVLDLLTGDNPERKEV